MSMTEANIMRNILIAPLTFNIKELNLFSLPEPENSHLYTYTEILNKKALRMFFMIWSGLTKFIRSLIYDRLKSVEILDFAIFHPRK